jgi:hypothetical protein
MKQIPLTQGKFATVDDEDYDRLIKYKWFVLKGYAARKIRSRRSGKEIINKTIYMHRELINASSEMQVDHINLDKLNNSKANLRVCTRYENQLNKSLTKNNTSGFKGVSWRKKDKKWKAQISVDKKTIFIGLFDNIIDAANAYDLEAIKYFKEFAFLNKAAAPPLEKAH